MSIVTRERTVSPGFVPYAVGLLLSVIALLIVIMAAIDVQSGRIPDAEGYGWSFATLFGPSGSRQGWAVLTAVDQLSGEGWDLFRHLMAWYLVVDVLFTAGYVALLLLIMKATGRRDSLFVIGTVAVILLGFVDLMENAAAAEVVWAAKQLALVLFFTTLKWVLVGACLFIVLLRIVVPIAEAKSDGSSEDGSRSRLARAGRAVYHQRFSYLPVLVIFVLSVASGPAILEQLPDVQRRWVNDGPVGMMHAGWAIGATLLLALFLIRVGHHRTWYTHRHPKPNINPKDVVAEAAATYPTTANDPATANDPPAEMDPDAGKKTTEEEGIFVSRYLIWLALPTIAVIGAVVVSFASGPGEVLWLRLIICLAVPAVIVGISGLLYWLWTPVEGKREPRLRERRYEPPLFDEAEANAVGVAGYIAGVAAVVVAGLSLWRAFIPLIILPPDLYAKDTDQNATVPTMVIVLLAVGLAGIVLPWVVMIGLRAKVVGVHDTRPTRTEKSMLANHGAWGLFGSVVLVFLILGFAPRLAALLGLTATAILAIGALTGLLSAVGLVLQDRPTAEVFRVLRLRRTPLVTVTLLTVLLVGVVGSGRGIHSVDRGAELPPSPAGLPPVDARPTLDQAFQNWASLSEERKMCEITVGGYRVRPMLMVATEGGGIRATYWTVRTLQAFGDEVCSKSPTLFSAGASGGSVGLTVARFSGSPADPGGEDAVEAVKSMARPETLSRAAAGTFVRDLLVGTTGVPLPRVGESDPWKWQDRARLFEDGWAETGQWGDAPFLSDSTTLSPSTGQLILNTTSVKDNCRVWISQVRLSDDILGTRQSFDPEQTCDKTAGPAPRTIDLFRTYGPYVPGGTDQSCLGLISATTAAMLTARFPYVTPSGVVGPCPDRQVRPGRKSDASGREPNWSTEAISRTPGWRRSPISPTSGFRWCGTITPAFCPRRPMDAGRSSFRSSCTSPTVTVPSPSLRSTSHRSRNTPCPS